MDAPFFSILIVCKNAGDKLTATLQSLAGQTFRDYEVIIKDALSADGTLDLAEKVRGALPALRIVSSADTGIYDGMNQAVSEACGKYVYFLNCGDFLADSDVLQQTAAWIANHPAACGIYYGDIRERQTGKRVTSNPQLNAFGCYRNVPCHQACFYEKSLLSEHPFDTKYAVRADYEQFLWCFFTKEKSVQFSYTGLLIADYEGGGFSETKENRKISAAEHKEIVRLYMSSGEIFRYRLMLWLTLAPLRTALAENPNTAGFYNRIKHALYSKK